MGQRVESCWRSRPRSMRTAAGAQAILLLLIATAPLSLPSLPCRPPMTQRQADPVRGFRESIARAGLRVACGRLRGGGGGGSSEEGGGDDSRGKGLRAGAKRGFLGDGEKKESSKLSQMKQARERREKKTREALDLDDERVEEFIRREGLSANRDLNDVLADNAADDDDLGRAMAGRTDLAEDGRYWEMSSGEMRERDLARSRRGDGSKTGWDRENDWMSSSEEKDLKERGVGTELFKPRGAEEGSDESEGDKLEELAVSGLQWNATLSRYQRRTEASTLVETMPYQRALRKAMRRGDYGTARALLLNLGGVEFASTRAVGAGLVKIVRGIIARSSEEGSASGGAASESSDDLPRKQKSKAEAKKKGKRGATLSGESALAEPARALLRKLVALSEKEGFSDESESGSGSSSERYRQEDLRGLRDLPARRTLEDDDDDIEEGAFEGEEGVMRFRMSVTADKMVERLADSDWKGVGDLLSELEESATAYRTLNERLIVLVKGLRRCGDSQLEARASKLVVRWKREAEGARREAADAVRGRGQGAGQGGDFGFDTKNCMKACFTWYEDGKCVARSARGNPKISVFAMWGAPGAGRLPGGGVEGVSEWTLRVDRCAGGTLHIGCLARPFPVEQGFKEKEEWSMAGVIGEAYNLRYTAYLVGSHGMVWEATGKGPRSLTKQVMEMIGEDERGCAEAEVTDGKKTYKVPRSNAIRFDAAGSMVTMTLDRDKGELRFSINQAPPFVLSGIREAVRPFVALKAVGDCVTLIDPRSVA